jgi:hypothetical protein
MNRIEELKTEIQVQQQAEFERWSEEMEAASKQLKEMQQKWQVDALPPRLDPPPPVESSPLISVPRINDITFENLFYDTDKKNFYVLKHRKKVRPTNNLRKIAWNTLHPKHIDRNGELKYYTYRFVLIPHGKNYVRIKEGELENYLAEERGEVVL